MPVSFDNIVVASNGRTSPHCGEDAMTSVDFAAAQKRVAARRLQKEADTRLRVGPERSQLASSALKQWPFPLRNIGQWGLDAWNVMGGREGNRPAFRVGQVDAELLDEELLELLKGQVGEALKYFGVRWKTSPERVEHLLTSTRHTYVMIGPRRYCWH